MPAAKCLVAKGNAFAMRAELRQAVYAAHTFPAVCPCGRLLGHYGYTHETAHQQRMRDVMGLEIGDGTAQIMKSVIAREKTRAIQRTSPSAA